MRRRKPRDRRFVNHYNQKRRKICATQAKQDVKENVKESGNNDKEEKPTFKKEVISIKIFLIYFIGSFLLLILSYKTGIRGYQIQNPLHWEELFNSLPQIFLFAIIASVVLYTAHIYVEKNS